MLGVFGQMAILSSDLEGNKQLAMVVPGQIATSSTIVIIVIVINTVIVIITITVIIVIIIITVIVIIILSLHYQQ